MTEHEFIKKLLLYRGIPYEQCGRDMNGLDCWGVVWLVYREVLGIELPRYDRDAVDPNEEAELVRFIDKEAGLWEEIDVDNARAGDVLLMWWRRPDAVTHIGLVVAAGTMLHVQVNRQVTFAPYREGFWSKRVSKCYRYRAAKS